MDAQYAQICWWYAMHPAAWDALDYKDCTPIFPYEIFAAFIGEHPLQNPNTHSLQDVTADMSSEKSSSKLSVRARGQGP